MTSPPDGHAVDLVFEEVAAAEDGCATAFRDPSLPRARTLLPPRRRALHGGNVGGLAYSKDFASRMGASSRRLPPCPELAHQSYSTRARSKTTAFSRYSDHSPDDASWSKTGGYQNVYCHASTVHGLQNHTQAISYCQVLQMRGHLSHLVHDQVVLHVGGSQGMFALHERWTR